MTRLIVVAMVMVMLGGCSSSCPEMGIPPLQGTIEERLATVEKFVDGEKPDFKVGECMRYQDYHEQMGGGPWLLYREVSRVLAVGRCSYVLKDVWSKKKTMLDFTDQWYHRVKVPCQ